MSAISALNQLANEEASRVEALSGLLTQFVDTQEETSRYIEDYGHRFAELRKKIIKLDDQTREQKQQHLLEKQREDQRRQTEQQYTLANNVRKKLEEKPDLINGMDEYFKAVDQALDNIQQLNENKIKLMNRAVDPLREWNNALNKAYIKMEDVFCEAMQNLSSRKKEMYGKDGSSRGSFGLEHNDLVKILRRIAQYLNNAKRSQYKTLYVSMRIECVKDGLAQLQNQLSRGMFIQEIFGVPSEQIIGESQSIQKEGINNTGNNGVLQREGSNIIYSLTTRIFRMLLFERELMELVISFNPLTFQEIIKQCITLLYEQTCNACGLVKTTEKGKDSTLDKMNDFEFIAFGTLRVVLTRRRELNRSLKDCPEAFNTLAGLYCNIASKARDRLKIWSKSLTTQSGNVPESGTIHDSTSQVMSYIQRLVKFDSVANEVLLVVDEKDAEGGQGLFNIKTFLQQPDYFILFIGEDQFNNLRKFPNYDNPDPNMRENNSPDYLFWSKGNQNIKGINENENKNGNEMRIPGLSPEQRASVNLNIELNQIIQQQKTEHEEAMRTRMQQCTQLQQFVRESILKLRDSLQTRVQPPTWKGTQLLANLFLMNNFRFIGQQLLLTDVLLYLLGADFVSQREEDAQMQQRDFQKNMIDRLLDVLLPSVLLQYKIGSIKKELENKSREALKKRFSTFNDLFTQIFVNGSGICIPDRNFRQTVTNQITQVLCETYESFHRKYSKEPFTTNQAKYLKFTPEAVRAQMDEWKKKCDDTSR